MMEKAIRAVNLTKSYGKLLAVDHINFEVKKGEIFGFLGPNGAGKTTTTRMLTGISKPTEGTAEVMGYDIQRQSVEAKELMGIVPDISNVYTDLSAWGNLIFTGRLYDIAKVERERSARELLQLFGLFDRRHESVQGFSRGMKRRLCIAMALMNKSSILFLDEPTSGLDVQSVLTIRNLVRKLNDDGLTIFLTTHNMEEANQMCDRVAIINRGKIAAIDTPERLKKTIKKLQFIEVSFVGATKNLTTDLKTIQGVTEVAKHGDKYRLNTENSPKLLSAIWEYASANELMIHTVNTLGPSLEDVFVKLTGITPEMKRKESELGIRAGS
ncbi:MAG: ATP-binding cassette domain-containing protein [Candidatus Bathyarchaeota archaeon]